MKIQMIGKTLLTLLITIAVMLAGVRPAQAQEVCAADEQKTEQVLDGLTLTWDSSFTCTNAPASGDYTITVTVQNDATSSETGIIDSVEFTLVTPLPGGNAPSATAEVSGLPITLAPGESGSFVVSGSYEMAATDEGLKINLHLRARGFGTSDNETFLLGINVHLFEGATDDPDNGDAPGVGDDPSSGFYCQQSETKHPFGARLAERYEVEYATLQAWFCEGFGWGQIMLALITGEITGDEPGTLLEERNTGAGWGDIWQRLGLIGPAEENGLPNNTNNNDGERPDFAGPPHDQDGDGKPDFAGPPPFAGPDNGGPPIIPGPPGNTGGGRP
ncbi:MAG TPA: hypothetical protein VNK49_03895 [Anaerolineales bacterium]|nr:hypothetical protein [Anaerolineales bacterium]